MAVLADIWYWALKILGILVIPLMVLSAVMMVRTVGKEQRVKPAPIVLQALSPFIVLAVYGFFLKLEPPEWLSLMLLGSGLVLGIVWSRSVKMSVQCGDVVSKRSALYVVIWTVTLVLTQLLAVFTNSQLAAYAYSTLYFSAGLAVGLNIALLLRGNALLSGQLAPPPPPPPASSVVPPPPPERQV